MATCNADLINLTILNDIISKDVCTIYMYVFDYSRVLKLFAPVPLKNFFQPRFPYNF